MTADARLSSEQVDEAIRQLDEQGYMLLPLALGLTPETRAAVLLVVAATCAAVRARGRRISVGSVSAQQLANCDIDGTAHKAVFVLASDEVQS